MLTPSTIALVCPWRIGYLWFRYATVPSGAKLFGAAMQMTAFIKGALWVIHCVPYHSFPKPQRFFGRHRGASTAASACQRYPYQARQSALGMTCQVAASSCLTTPLCIVRIFVLILWSVFLSVVHGVRPTKASGKTHWKCEAFAKTPGSFFSSFCMKWITLSSLPTWKSFLVFLSLSF